MSLPDFHNHIISDPRILSKHKKINKDTPNADYNEVWVLHHINSPNYESISFVNSVKHPYRAYEFLKFLNTRLSNSSNSEVGISKSKHSDNQKHGNLVRLNGLQLMASFGLKYCQLSKKSIQQLQVDNNENI